MSRLKYKVGDRVKIQSLERYNKYKNRNGDINYGCETEILFTSEMSSFCGQVVTITRVRYIGCVRFYHIVEDEETHLWVDGMFECLVERNGKTYPYKIGDRVVLKGNNRCATITDLKYNSWGNLSYYIKIDNDKDISTDYPTDLLLPYDNIIKGFVEEETKILTSASIPDGPYITSIPDGPYTVTCDSPSMLVVPKFKVGDKITNGKVTLTILTLSLDRYVVKDNFGKCGTLYFNSQDDWKIVEEETKSEPKFHIQDAKDGDVLAEDSCIFIIQKLGDNGTAAKTHCTLYDDGVFENGSILYFDIDSTKPATEEEKQKLFNAIKDNGYKWNPETKTLEKPIEPKFREYSDNKSLDVPKMTTEFIKEIGGLPCPEGYVFKDENGNVINATKIVLEKLVVPKFKKGDKIKDKNNRVWYVVQVGNRHFDISRIPSETGSGYFVPIEDQDYYELCPNTELPKTFEECVSVLMLKGENRMSLEQMNTFRKLIDARNAYWTIYGEENGLGKPWEPDYNNEEQPKYGLYDILKYSLINPSQFVFPTEEMRDTFYENFKKEIEQCKEL